MKKLFPTSLLLALFAALLTVTVPAIGEQPVTETPTTTETTPASKVNSTSPRVLLSTNQGDITLELDAMRAPKTVANFIAYVEAGHYAGTIFHRVIDNFMVQGGGFTADYQQKPSRDPIENEADNGLTNEEGTVAMARTNAPHSASSQFFINVKNNSFLNHSSPTPSGWGYAVFGKVVEGMDIVNKIKVLPTGSGGPFGSDVPTTAIVIESAKVVE